MEGPPDIVERILEHAQARPNRPAVIDGDNRTTYGELVARARSIASSLSTLTRPSVVIALPQGAAAYASMIAVSLVGGFYVPVNVEAPLEKIQRIIGIVQPDAIIAKTKSLARQLGRDSRGSMLLDESWDSRSSLFVELAGRHELAYVMFTSGSTGAPKGVMIPRAALNHYVNQMVDDLGLVPDDRVAQHPNIAFDVSVFGIYGALCTGATAYPLTSAGDRLVPARFIQREKLTVWISVPSVVSLMMRAKDVREDRLNSVRLFVFCGEPLLPSHLEAIFQACPNCLVMNTYGPTEATVSVTSLSLNKSNYRDACELTVALGEPIPGSAIHLVGGSDQREGEIVISGKQLASGYWNDPHLTREKFKAVRIDGAEVRGYFTGDWGVRRGANLFFKERIDFQVKIKGYRVETDEIAAAIRNCGWPFVCVFKHEEALAAVVEDVSGESFDEQRLRQQLASKLEDYAIPTTIRLVDQLPRNQNDKIDRAAVVDWFQALDR